MKPNTVRNWKIGLALVASLSIGVARNSITASSEPVPIGTGQESTDGPPAPPPGDPTEAPPAIPALTPPPLNVSPGMEEIFRMARSGVSEEVLTAFIEHSGRAYHPNSDEIIYLKDLGVAPNTIAAIIQTGTGNARTDGQAVADAPDQVGNTRDDVSVVGKDGKTTVNVTTHNHYAAAPQSLEDQAAVDGAVAQPAAQETVDLSYFKSALSPYGSWVYIDGVGECWRPTVSVVNASWRPYYDAGRWIYSDAGWYWLSDYSWGWAPFHYGRWHLSAGSGWVWAPGYNWGPAWVSWRRTSTYCGWAPLPAYRWGAGYGYYGSGWSFSFGISWGSYCWVPYRYCYGYYPRYYSAPSAINQEIYNNSTVIKPTIIGDNNTIIINGPNATTVAKAANTEIRQVRIRDTTNLRDPGPKDYIENGGQSLAAFRPTVRSSDTRSASSEVRRSRTSAAVPSDSTETAANVESQRRSGVASTQSNTMRTPVANNASSAPSRSTTGTTTTFSSETSRRSPAAVSTTETTARLAGQNTTIERNPTYRTPAVQSTPILRDGRTVKVNAPVRYTRPVVSGGLTTETRRATTYPGSTSVYSTRQTVRTPTASQATRPTTQGPPSYAPTRQPTSTYSSPARTETSRSRPPSTYSAPTAVRTRIPASAPPTRSYAPRVPSYSRPAASPSRPTISSAPARIPSSPSVSRAPSSSPMRAPSAAGRSGAPSRAPSRR